MGAGGALLVCAGVVLAFVNAVATRRLWASPIFETPQKIAQTVLLWVLPGTVVVVWSVLREPRLAGQADATGGGAAFTITDALLSSAAEHHHSGSGGGHHPGDGGGHGHHSGDGGGGGGHGGGGGFDGGGGHGGGGFDGGGHF